MGDITPVPVRINLYQPYVVTHRRGDGFPHRSTMIAASNHLVER
jgi:hypothetical protein